MILSSQTSLVVLCFLENEMSLSKEGRGQEREVRVNLLGETEATEYVHICMHRYIDRDHLRELARVAVEAGKSIIWVGPRLESW